MTRKHVLRKWALGKHANLWVAIAFLVALREDLYEYDEHTFEACEP